MEIFVNDAINPGAREIAPRITEASAKKESFQLRFIPIEKESAKAKKITNAESYDLIFFNTYLSFLFDGQFGFLHVTKYSSPQKGQSLSILIRSAWTQHPRLSERRSGM